MTVHALPGKRVLITGAQGGIAQASIAALRAGGATVYGVDLRAGDDVRAADVRDPDAMLSAVAAAVERMGGIDILVNCAGIGTAQDVGSMPGDEVRRTIDINLLGPWTTTAAALPHLLAAHGHVVNVTSVLAVISLPFASAYSASKHALDAYSNCLRIEYHGRVSVTTVRPGYVRTHIHDGPAQRGVSLEGVTNEDSVEQAAAAIVRACTHRPRTVVTSRSTAVGIWFGQHLPRLVERAIIRRGSRYQLAGLGPAPEGNVEGQVDSGRGAR
ncbi:MAG TPA: SDR family NAD(P)-dependent oxidoreductase [Candidatus Dormibacteraeota bacterium]|jgi:NAD(P)-dependent dehydrogenase (short-subunit alcohol dehydrogenase family)